MIEQKTRVSVWSVAAVAVFFFLAVVSLGGVFSTTENTASIAASVVN